MTVVSEKTIDHFLDRYDSEEHFLHDLTLMSKTQPDLMSFIDQENYSLLTKDELALLEYLTVVIFFASQEHNAQITIKGKALEKAEEENWNIFNASTEKRFENKLDTFFKDYSQEDLLALVEDSIQIDENDAVTVVGREIIFIACKSIIDTIHNIGINK